MLLDKLVVTFYTLHTVGYRVHSLYLNSFVLGFVSSLQLNLCLGQNVMQSSVIVSIQSEVVVGARLWF
jgi:hypothetical protein